MTRLTFYGGVGEVGGNKILLEDGESRLFLDFGISYHRRALYFEEFLNPRPGAGLTDVLEMGLLPPLEGLYRTDLTPDSGLWERYRSHIGYREMASVDAVLLSHAHLDHSGYISFLKPDIPIYASAMTAFVAKAIQDTAPSDIEKEVCYANSRQISGGYLGTARGQGYQQRPFVFVDGQPSPREAVDFWGWSPTKSRPLVGSSIATAATLVAGLRLRSFPVDHSIYGATAYAVETGDGWLVYSGDLRLHGSRGQLTQRFAEQAAALRPTALICEGTRAGESRRVTEDEVSERCLGAVRAAEGIVIADFGPRNVDRLLSFYRIAQATGRALVVLAKDAYLLDAMRLASDDVPDIAQCADLLIYDDLRARDEQWRAAVRERHGSHFVGPSVIRHSPGAYILCFSFWDVNDLIDIGPVGGSYIYSSSEAYDEEAKFDLRRLRNWIEHFGMKSVGLPLEVTPGCRDVPSDQHGFHASGHASGPELIDIIRTIRPKMLIPVHTERPEAFIEALRGSDIEVRLPQCALDVPWPECAIELG